jgi:hypothetical protein
LEKEHMIWLADWHSHEEDRKMTHELIVALQAALTEIGRLELEIKMLRLPDIE